MAQKVFEVFEDFLYDYLDDGGIVLKEYIGNDDYVSVPSEIDGVSVRVIDFNCFNECLGLVRVDIPSGVEIIGAFAFDNCRSLQEISLPDTIQSIGVGAFGNCGSLQLNQYDNGLYLGNDNNPFLAFIRTVGADITSCEIHKDAKVIYGGAFCNSKIKSIVIPEGVLSIGGAAFWGCRELEKVSLPDTLQFMSNCIFAYCYKLRDITVPAGVEYIGNDIFYKCDDLTVCCKAKSQPDEWEKGWNSSRPVVWNKA